GLEDADRREGVQDQAHGERDLHSQVSVSRGREGRDARRAAAGGVGLQLGRHHAYARDPYLSAAPEDREGPLARRAAGDRDGRLQARAVGFPLPILLQNGQRDSSAPGPATRIARRWVDGYRQHGSAAAAAPP